MHIEPVPYLTFQSLVTCTHALRQPDNDGCAWYASSDRRVAGRIYLDEVSELFRATVLHFVRAGWEVRELRGEFGNHADAEAALISAMQEEIGLPVSVHEVPMRLRFGKGRIGRRRK